MSLPPAVLSLLLLACTEGESSTIAPSMPDCDPTGVTTLCDTGLLRTPFLARSGGLVGIVAEYELQSSEVPPSEVTFSVLFNGQEPALPFFASYEDLGRLANHIVTDLSEEDRESLETNKALIDLAGGQIISFLPEDRLCAENRWTLEIQRSQDRSSGCLRFGDYEVPIPSAALSIELEGHKKTTDGFYLIEQAGRITFRLIVESVRDSDRRLSHLRGMDRVLVGDDRGRILFGLLGPSPEEVAIGYFDILGGKQTIRTLVWDQTDDTGAVLLASGRYYIVALVQLGQSDGAGTYPSSTQLFAGLQAVFIK